MYIKLVSKYGLTDIGFEYNFLSRQLPYKIHCVCNAQCKCKLYYRSCTDVNIENILATDISGSFELHKNFTSPKGLCIIGMMFNSCNIGDSLEITDFRVTLSERNVIDKISYLNPEDMFIYGKDNKLIDIPKNIIKQESRILNPEFYYKLKNFNNGRCFIIGNGPSVKSIDLDKLKGELVISCNHFLEESNFLPTINCAGDVQLIFDKIYNNFEYDNNNGYNKTKNGIIYLYHISSFLLACFDFHTNKYRDNVGDKQNIYKFNKFEQLYKPEEILDRFQKIIDDNGNLYLIEDLYNFTLTRNVKKLIENQKLIYQNASYTNRYYNVIPMMSMLIATMLGCKRLYLIGCDGHNFDEHFYDKQTGVELFADLQGTRKDLYYKQTLNGFKRRMHEYKEKNIEVINCNVNSKYDFYKSFPLEKVINDFSIEDIDNYILGVNNVTSLKIRNAIKK
jgi:hypothetical protein